jgi:hypothetical protein
VAIALGGSALAAGIIYDIIRKDRMAFNAYNKTIKMADKRDKIYATVEANQSVKRTLWSHIKSVFKSLLKEIKRSAKKVKSHIAKMIDSGKVDPKQANAAIQHMDDVIEGNYERKHVIESTLNEWAFYVVMTKRLYSKLVTNTAYDRTMNAIRKKLSDGVDFEHIKPLIKGLARSATMAYRNDVIDEKEFRNAIKLITSSIEKEDAGLLIPN